MRKYFIGEKVEDRIIKIIMCKANKIIADDPTKNLPARAFEQHSMMIRKAIVMERLRTG